MDGVLNINKPAGMTSHDVVARLRRLLDEKKVGHTGTLDPDATGVLPICLGKATKIIQFLQDGKKGYEGTITLGITTDTLDASGEILNVADSTHVTPDDAKRIFNDFIGEIDQIPPMVSAVKFKGKRLYSIARQGKTVDRESRKVNIYDLELLAFNTSSSDTVAAGSGIPELFVELDFRVLCSRGTYVRSLAADIGDALGCGAHLSKLIRTRSGIFELADSIKLADIQSDPQKAQQIIRSMDSALGHMPVISITDSAGKRFLNGVAVSRSEVVCYEGKFQVDDVIRVHDEADIFLGIGKATAEHGMETENEGIDSRSIICKVVKVLRKI